MQPIEWMRKATLLAVHLIRKIPLPFGEEPQHKTLPDIQIILDKADIEKRIKDHHDTFKLMSIDEPINVASIRQLGVKMDLWHARQARLEALKRDITKFYSTKTMMTGQEGDGSAPQQGGAAPAVNVIIGPVNINQGNSGGSNGNDQPEEERPPNDPTPDPTPPPGPTPGAQGVPNLRDLCLLPCRGFIVAYSRGTLGQTIDEAARAIYSAGTDGKILHIRRNCSGMVDPQVHFLPHELAAVVRWCGNQACANWGRQVDMPNYCPCCDNLLNPGGNRVDIVRYSKHCMTRVVTDHVSPINRDSTCNERYQRQVLIKSQEYRESRETLRMAGRAGRAIVVGDWVGRMLEGHRYWHPHF